MNRDAEIASDPEILMFGDEAHLQLSTGSRVSLLSDLIERFVVLRNYTFVDLLQVDFNCAIDFCRCMYRDLQQR
ncbi:hypothetical protein C8R48DRAFT_688925 [Suillus tomentosus]|nr:hypothetical protein C8R48DRAFT_688925 [Suillus tomentosus]